MHEGRNYHIDALFILIFVVPAYALVEIGFLEFIEFMLLWSEAQ